MRTNKSEKRVLDAIERVGYVQVSVKDPFHAARRRMLQRMEQAGQIKLVQPVIGSYMTYTKAT